MVYFVYIIRKYYFYAYNQPIHWRNSGQYFSLKFNVKGGATCFLSFYHLKMNTSLKSFSNFNSYCLNPYTYSVIIGASWVFITVNHLRCHPIWCSNEAVSPPISSAYLGTHSKIHCKIQHMYT